MNTELIDMFADAVASKVIAKLAVQSSPKPNRLIPASDASVYIGKSKQALYHLVNQNKIPVARVGKKLYFDKHDLDKWIEEKKD